MRREKCVADDSHWDDDRMDPDFRRDDEQGCERGL
jgi:hypothetical protein